MTVTYTAEVSTAKGFGCFLKLLPRWRASIYKLIWSDLLAFLALYYMFNLLYRFLLNDNQKLVFERIVYYCNSYGSLIPVSFVLGFYVIIVVDRWWQQYTSLPWPDPIAVYVSALLRGQDEHGRVMRRTVMRYVCLCFTMVLTMLSPAVKKRFPTLDHLVDGGLLVENEKNIIKSMDEKFPKHCKHWMPIVWASSIITRARKEGRIRDDYSLKTIIDELNKFRGVCATLIHYNIISIPLVYTQVVSLAVYSYFVSAILGQQCTDKSDQTGFHNAFDKYFPVFTTLEFFFYVGLLKVAESLICPFGENDDDFELNWMIDRCLQVSYLIVDEMHNEHPQLIKDQYWDEIFPNELPYPSDAEIRREEPPQHSTAKLNFPKPSTLTSPSTVKLNDIASSTVIFWKRQNTLENQSSLSNISHVNSTIMRFFKRSTTATGSQDRLSASLSASFHIGVQTTSGAIESTSAAKKPSRKTQTFNSIRDLDKEHKSEVERDDFEILREEREIERADRHTQKIMRTFENANKATFALAAETNKEANMSSQQPAEIVSTITIGITAQNSVISKQLSASSKSSSDVNNHDTEGHQNTSHRRNA